MTVIQHFKWKQKEGHLLFYWQDRLGPREAILVLSPSHPGERIEANRIKNTIRHCLSLYKKDVLCYVMLCYVMLCYVTICYVMLCYVMLCYVTLCYVMLCYVMLCYVMLC